MDVVTREVQEALGAEMKVEFSGQTHLDPLPSGKHRFIVAAPPADARSQDTIPESKGEKR